MVYLQHLHLSCASDLRRPFLQRINHHAYVLQTNCLYQRCANGNAAALDFNLSRATNETFFPDMLEGDLLLSHVVSAAGSRMTSTNKTEASLSENKTRRNRGHGGENGTSPYGGGQSGVVWKVSALPQLSDNGRSMMNWTIFPSSGLLLPGQRCVWCDTTG